MKGADVDMVAVVEPDPVSSPDALPVSITEDVGVSPMDLPPVDTGSTTTKDAECREVVLYVDAAAAAKEKALASAKDLFEVKFLDRVLMRNLEKVRRAVDLSTDMSQMLDPEEAAVRTDKIIESFLRRHHGAGGAGLDESDDEVGSGKGHPQSQSSISSVAPAAEDCHMDID
jgi:hypothetical protein